MLIAGGVDNNDALLATAELYDPAVGTFSASAENMTSARWSHTATLLANGKVLLAGGRSNSSPNLHSATAELFDPSTNTFTMTGSMTTGRDFHTATLLPDGRVLLKSWANALKSAGIPYFWLYNLRHTFASRLSAAGVSDLFVAQMIGHSTPSIVQTYAKAVDEYRRDAIRKMERLRGDSHEPSSTTIRPIRPN